MGRKPDVDSGTLVALVDQFFIRSSGNPEKLTFAALSRFACDQGFSIPEQKFRRCQAVIRRRNELLAMGTGAPVPVPDDVLGYASLDIPAGVRRCRDAGEADAYLSGLNAAWHALYRRKIELELETRRLKEQLDALGNELNTRRALQEKTVRDLTDENRRLKTQVRELMKLMKEYVYPSAAVMLLQKRIPTLELDGFINPEGIEPFIGHSSDCSPEEGTQPQDSPQDAFLALLAGKENADVF